MYHYKKYVEEYKKFAEEFKEMKDNGHNDISGCIQELEKNPRLKGPLVMYCLLLGIPRVIEKDFSAFYSECISVSELYKNHQPLPRPYEKVMWSFGAYKLQKESALEKTFF